MSEPTANTTRPEGLPRRVIVAGYGPVGRVIVDQLETDGLQVTIIELNLTTIERQLDLDKSIIYGDVSDPEILRLAGVHEAEALILTVPDEEAALQACHTARQMAPHIFIAARTSYVSKGLLASQAGADQVVVEEVVTAQAMREAVCRHLSDRA